MGQLGKNAYYLTLCLLWPLPLYTLWRSCRGWGRHDVNTERWPTCGLALWSCSRSDTRTSVFSIEQLQSSLCSLDSVTIPLVKECDCQMAFVAFGNCFCTATVTSRSQSKGLWVGMERVTAQWPALPAGCSPALNPYRWCSTLKHVSLDP